MELIQIDGWNSKAKKEAIYYTKSSTDFLYIVGLIMFDSLLHLLTGVTDGFQENETIQRNNNSKTNIC